LVRPKLDGLLLGIRKALKQQARMDGLDEDLEVVTVCLGALQKISRCRLT